MTIESADKQPWDDLALQSAVRDAARSARRVPIIEAADRHSSLAAPTGAAAYLVFIEDPNSLGGAMTGLLGPLARASEPCYVGSAVACRARMLRHLTMLRAASGLDPEHVTVALIPADSHAAALYMERSCIADFDPIFNRSAISGWGSRNQGRSRNRTQRPTDFDCIFPRTWARPTDPVRRTRTVLEVACFVTAPERGDAWRDEIVDCPG